MFMNLIASELAIAVLLLLDFLGSFTRGKIYERNSTICTMSGFTHSFFCKQLFDIFILRFTYINLHIMNQFVTILSYFLIF